jgi:hypothetical protein
MSLGDDGSTLKFFQKKSLKIPSKVPPNLKFTAEKIDQQSAVDFCYGNASLVWN